MGYLGVSENMCNQVGVLITNLNRCLDRWLSIFNRSSTTHILPIQLAWKLPWSVQTDPPSAEEMHSVVNALKCRRSPGGDDLNPELFKAGGDALIGYLTSLPIYIYILIHLTYYKALCRTNP